MDKCLHQATLSIADINAIAQGVAVSLDSMEEELCGDPRYYVLRVCIEAIVSKSSDAPDAIDMYKISLANTRQNQKLTTDLSDT